MLRDAAIDLIAQRLGNRKDLKNRILNEMHVVQQRLEDRTPHPWFLEKLTSVTAEEGGDATITLPADFIVEAEEGGVVPVIGGERKRSLIKRDYDELAYRYPGTADYPSAYALVANRIVFFPKYTKEFEFLFLYVGRDQILSTNIENVWLKEAPELLMSEVGIKMAALHLQAPRLADAFKEQAQVEWGILLRRHEERKIANVEAFAGGE